MKHFWRGAGFAVALVFLLAACGSVGSSGASESQVVQITETDFHIASSVNTFISGKTYQFQVTNQSKTAHEFMIMPRAEGSMSGMPMGTRLLHFGVLPHPD